MQSIRTRQLRADLAYDGSTYTTAKPWDLATGSTLSDAAIATEAYVTSAVAAGAHAHVDAYVFVDSNRSSETYTETGSEVAPYRTLSAAVSTKLADNQTDLVVFKLAPGTYTGTISRDKATANQTFEILGSGSGNTFIKGSTSWDATTSHVLYFRDFLSIKIRDVTISNGAYGIYTRSTPLVRIENCVFTHLGSSGTNHGFERTQAQMAADWATQGSVGSNRSDGGVMRIRSSSDVVIRNCTAGFTLRGFRLQNCSQGRIIGCTVRSSLESAFYLAASDYTGATGCSNFFISDCRAEDVFHNGYLVIGGSDNTIVGCRAYNCASSAVVGWHTQDLRVQGCVFDKCTHKTYIGIGGLGDTYGCVMFVGKENITDTSGYMLTALNNSMLRCGQGRASAIVAFWFGALDDTVTSFRAVLDGNNTDAATVVHKDDQDIPLTSTQYPAAPSQAEFDSLESDVGDNTTAIAGLGFSGTADKAVVTDSAGSLSTSAVTKSQLLHLQNVSSDIKNQFDNRLKLDTAQTLSSGWLTIQKTNDDASLWVTRSGSSTLKLEAKNGYGRIRYSGAKFDMWSSGRYKMDGSHLQLPMNASAPTDNAANSKGGLWVDSTTSPHKLMFHDGVVWKEVSLS